MSLYDHDTPHDGPVAGIGAEKGILAGLLGGDEAQGFNGILLKKLGGVKDTFVIGDESFFGGLWVGGHAVGCFPDFLDGSALVENEEVVLGDVGV